MKKTFLYLIGYLLAGSVTAQEKDSITVSGIIKGLNGGKVNLSWPVSAAQSTGLPATAAGDAFSFRVPLQNQPVVAWLYLPARQGPAGGHVNFFLFNSDVRLQYDTTVAGNVSIKGDKENDLYNVFLQQTAGIEKRNRELLDRMTELHNKGLQPDDAWKQDYQALSRERTRIEKAFIQRHPAAFASLFLLSRSEYRYGADEYMYLWNQLSPVYKKTITGESVATTVERLRHTRSGTPVFPFERKDLNGNTVSTELLKGKVYLLDFWGSWCGPCRASHPHLRELYRKYRSKGFEIVSIAQERAKTLEDCKANWQKAIREDGIDWIHILNQDGIDQQDIVKTYRVTSFPTKILVGSDGKIITRMSASVADAIDRALEKIYGF